MDEQISEECLKIETGLCRCCHGEGSFKTLGVSCFNNEEQVFSDILLECLDINITPVPGPLFDVTYSICDVCILKLQDAFNFKKQVMVCEERFRDMYRRNAIKVVPVKIETQETDVKPENADSYHADDHADNDANDNADMDDFMGFSHPDDIHLDMELQNDKDDVRKKEKKAKGLKDKTKTSGKNVKKVGRPRKNPDEEEKKQKKDTKFGKSYCLIEGENSKKYYMCYECGKKLRRLDSMKDHITNHHSETDIKCPLCREKFKKVCRMRLHLLKVHGVKEIRRGEEVKEFSPMSKYKCDICKKEFFNKILMRNHINKIHGISKCPDCPLKFVTSTELPFHRHEVHGIPIPTCGVCGYKNVSQSRVIMHQRRVHLKEKNVACEYCDLKFFDENSMKKHAVKHKPEKIFQCSYCHKKYSRLSTLRMHEKIHTGEKNKVCSICNERFVQKASLNYHMIKHHTNHDKRSHCEIVVYQ